MSMVEEPLSYADRVSRRELEFLAMVRGLNLEPGTAPVTTTPRPRSQARKRLRRKFDTPFQVPEAVLPAPGVRHQVQLPPLAELLDLEALRPKRGRGYGTAGAGALAELLYELARHKLRTDELLKLAPGQPKVRPPAAPRRQVVVHLSAELLAATLGRNQDTVNTWTKQLHAQGFLHARAHYTTVTTRDGQRVTAIDGTLYAISLEAGHRAHLSYRDLHREYRDLEADRQAKRTAYQVVKFVQELRVKQQELSIHDNALLDEEKNIRGSSGDAVRKKYLKDQLRAWAVTPGGVEIPPLKDVDARIFQIGEMEEGICTVQDVVYLLPSVAEAHASKRAALVGILGAALSRALNDQHSRAWYCKVIWNAWKDEIEGRGGLQVLAAQLARLDVDRLEWKELRNPAALLAARLHQAA